MKNIILLIIVTTLLYLGCSRGNTEIHLPDWLHDMTDSLEANDSYWGSRIYRHDWKSEYYYHLFIPLSSCAYCNVYKENGQDVNWKLENIEEYVAERDNEVIVWEWNKE